MSSHGEKESKTKLKKLDQRGRQLLSEHQNHPHSCWGVGGLCTESGISYAQHTQ